MKPTEIIGIILIIAALIVLQFVGGSAGIIGGIALGAAGIVLSGVWKHKPK